MTETATIETKQGYKKTKLGLIPEDWEVKSFGELFSFVPTYSFSRANLEMKEPNDTHIINIHYGDIHSIYKEEILDFDSEKLVPIIVESNQLNKDFKFLKDGDLLIADASEDYKGVCDSIELVNVGEKKVTGGLHTFVARDLNGETYQGFRCFILKNEIVHNNLKKIATGISVYGVSKRNLSKIQIPVPTLLEQEKISMIIHTWDNAIQTLTQLIFQKEQLKKALMQQLLTGKKRLKGFNGEWEEKKIKQFSKEISLKNKEDKDMLVLSCTKHYGLVPSLEYFGRRIYSDKLHTYKIVEKGQFVYATNHIEEGSIGYQNEYDQALISPMYTVFKTDDSLNDTFFFRVLKSHELIHEYNKRMEGSIDRRGGLRWRGFSEIKVKIPSVEEQTAIDKILKTADREIDLFSNKLQALKDQKKGLMQQLLTGKKRLNKI